MDDVTFGRGTFGRNGRDAEKWRLHRAATAMNGVAISGRSLMSITACYCLGFPFHQRPSHEVVHSHGESFYWVNFFL